MSERWFYVRPFETAFFGPPDAQSAGETHFASSLFPPSPRTFQGLVRTRLLQSASKPPDLSDRSRSGRERVASLVGGPDSLPEGWQMDGPFPVSEDSAGHLMPWLPSPSFLRQAMPGMTHPKRAGYLIFSEDDRSIGGLWSGDRLEGAGRSPIEPEQIKGAAGSFGSQDAGPLGGWLNARNFLWAMAGDGAWDENDHSRMPPTVCRERRTGLALEREEPASDSRASRLARERRAMDHMLYSREDLRFSGCGGFLGNLTAELPPGLSSESLTNGAVPFGRGNRLAGLEPAAKLDPAWGKLVAGSHLPPAPEESLRFWLVLITPARFDNQFLGSDGSVSRSVFRPKLYGVSGVRFLGAMLFDPVTLGGYSIAENRARSNSRYVSSGSSWLFELEAPEPSERGAVLRALNGSHCLGRRDESAMGFGQVLVGIDRSGI
jgi:CRISPR/Cas system CMR-associated protein Cmr3 (group 5 of RAMP superfamily)